MPLLYKRLGANRTLQRSGSAETRPSSPPPSPSFSTYISDLQGRLGLAVTNRRADLVRRGLLALRAGRQQLAALLAHVVLLLHGGELLVLGKGQRKGHAEEEGRRGDDPRGLTAKRQGRPRGARDGVELARDPAARRGRDDVAQGV